MKLVWLSKHIAQLTDYTDLELEQVRMICQATWKGFKGRDYISFTIHGILEKFQMGVGKMFYMPTGFWYRVHVEMLRYGMKLEIDESFNHFVLDQSFDISKFDAWADSLDTPFGFRYYQRDVTINNLKFFRNHSIVGTSGGKTFVCYMTFRHLFDHSNKNSGKKMLAVVPSQQLCQQMSGDFKKYQTEKQVLKVYKIFSNAKNDISLADANVVVGTYHSLRELPDDWFDNFDTIFVDEAHGTKSKSIETVMKKMRKAGRFFGMTGSMYIDYKDASLHAIEQYIGSNLYEYRAQDLINDGYATPLNIIPVSVSIPHERTSSHYDMILNNLDDKGKCMLGGADIVRMEQELAYNDRGRNMALAKLICSFPKNHVVLTRRLGNVRNIAAACELYCQENNIDKKIWAIEGKVKLDKRLDMVEACEKDHNRNVIIATIDTIGTGISVNEWFYASLVDVGKSAFTLIQAVGRMLRLHDDKKVAPVMDIHTKLISEYDKSKINSVKNGYGKSNYLEKHSVDRIKVYAIEKFNYIKTTLNITT